MSQRSVSLVVMVVGGIAFVVLAAVLVPWHPAPGGTPSPAAADTIFTQAQVDRAESYSRWSRAWSWSSLGVSLLIACVLGFGPWGRRIVARLRGWWWVRVVLAVAALEVIGRVLTLPFAIALRRHALDHGISTQSWSGFAVDMVKNELIAILVTSLALVLLVGCARRLPRAWPAVAGGILAVLVMLGSFVYPIVVEPLFNSFSSLPDGELRTQVLALADKEHVEIDDVLVADASRRTTTLNAYVSGYGSTRRVVLYDTLLDDADEDQVLSVVAHELTHARYDDVLTGSLLGAAGVVFGVGLLGLLVGTVGERRRLTMGDPEVVPLVVALIAIGSLLALPVQNTISRHIETRADVGALQATADPTAFIEVQRELALHSLADPDPPWLSQLWFGSHPAALTRVAIAEQYERQPW